MWVLHPWDVWQELSNHVSVEMFWRDWKRTPTLVEFHWMSATMRCVCVSVCLFVRASLCVCVCVCVYASVFVYLLILHNLLPPAAGSRVSERGCSSPSWCSLLVWPQHCTQWWDTCGNYINVSTVGLYPMCCCVWDSCKTYNSEYVRQLSSSVVDPLLPWMLHLCTYGCT